MNFLWLLVLGGLSAQANPGPPVKIPEVGAQSGCNDAGEKLVLVNWSSQSCTAGTESGETIALGSCQADTLDKVVEFLFGSDRKLGSCDRVFVFPEGVEEHSRPFADRVGQLKRLRTPLEKQKWVHQSLDRHLATHGVRYKPHAFSFRVGEDLAQARKDFEVAVCKHVLAPMIQGVSPTQCGGARVLRGHPASPEHQRAVSRYYLSLLPELVHAFDVTGYSDTDAPEEVLWLWAGTGFRDYDDATVKGRIRGDLGHGSSLSRAVSAYYDAVMEMFAVDPITSHASDWLRVREIRLKPSDDRLWNGSLKTAKELGLQWRNPKSGEPALLTHNAKWIGFSGDNPTWKSTLLSWIRKLANDEQSQSLSDFPAPEAWELQVPNGLEIAKVELIFQDQSVQDESVLLNTVGKDNRSVSIADPSELQDLLLKGLMRWAQSNELGGTKIFELSTTLQVVPVNQSLRDFTQALGKKEVLIRRNMPGVPSPTISAAYEPISALQWTILAVISGAFLLAFGCLWWAITRRRELDIEVDWQDSAAEIDLSAHRESAQILLDFVVQVSDPTPFWARRTPIDLVITLRTYTQPEIPLHSGKESTFQSLVSSAPGSRRLVWEKAGENSFSIRISRPTIRALHDHPLTLLTRHAVVDFAKVESEQLRVMVALEIKAEPQKYYSAVPSTLCVRELSFSAVPGPATPACRMDVFTHIIARHLALELQGATPANWNRSCRIQVGTIEFSNPAAERYKTLPVQFRLTSAQVTLTTSFDPTILQAQVLLNGQLFERADDLVWEVACHPANRVFDSAEKDLVPTRVALGIQLPEELRDHKSKEWRVSIAFSVEACDLARPNDWVSFPKIQREFNLKTAGEPRIVCLDFGTSATRMLLQDQGLDSWGYLPLGRLLAKGSDEDPANLPSNVFLAEDGVQFGNRAEQSLAMWPAKKGPPPYIDSIKGLLLEGDERAAKSLERVVRGLFEQGYQPTVDAKNGVAVFQDSASGQQVGVDLQPGERQQLVAMLPNDAAPLYANTMESVLNDVFSGTVRMMREAEGVALWYGAEAFDLGLGVSRGGGEMLRILVIDVGAGTTDVALVEVHRPEARQVQQRAAQQRTRILSTGGARIGGRNVEEALFNAAAKLSKVEVSWDDLDDSVRWRIRPRIERDKKALSLGRLKKTLAFSRREIIHGDLSVPYEEIVQHPIYRALLERMVREPLAVLVGRRAIEGISDVDRVVVSGRGAQTYDFMTTLTYILNSEFGISPNRIARVEQRFLKSAVTLGARLFSLGLCGDFVPSDLSFRNRILLLTRQSSGVVTATELLPPGRSFGGGAIVGDWTAIRAWEAAVLIETWLRPNERERESAPRWHLTPRGISAILRGEPLQEIAAASAYTRLDVSLGALSNRAKLAGGIELRACVSLAGVVTLEPRKTDKKKGPPSA